MKLGRKPLSKRLGSALVMTLVIIVLITVVTVGYLASVMLQTKTAGATLDQERAYGLAMVGAHQAMAKIRDALGPWDDPYRNFATSPPTFFWSSSPGRITHWGYSSLSPLSNCALFSQSSSSNLVNLNKPLVDSSTPIIGGGTNAPDLSVRWVPILRNPVQPAGATNPIVGRYAFWVDSESSKININTADGTERTNAARSLGIGTPSEVSLEVIASTNAQSIVQIARTSNFHSPQEILRASGISTNVFRDNVFSLTAYSRSPEMNVFGEPRMALTPLLGAAYVYNSGVSIPGTNMVINGITLRPGIELYPTPSQLTNYQVRNPITSNSTAVPWPLAFRAEGASSLGRMQEYRQFDWISVGPNYCYINGALLANYLAGTNAVGQQVTWPAFSGSSALNFREKYSPRQIDSIVAQIVSLGSKLISSDYPYPDSGDYPSGMNVADSASDPYFDKYLEKRGCRYNNAPFLFPGWLSGQFVNGMGRTVKLSGLQIQVACYGSSGIVGDPVDPYVPPKARLDFWLEWWLPSRFQGGPSTIPAAPEMTIGHREHKGMLNNADVTAKLDVNPFLPAPLPKSSTGGSSFWGNQLLINNQGIDFACNPSIDNLGRANFKDPENLGLAPIYHNPYALYTPPPPEIPYYVGQGGPFSEGFRTPLRVTSPVGATEFSPGEIRSVGSRFYSERMAMQTNPTGSPLNIGGGIAVRSQLFAGYWTDPDPVPLEAIRGASGHPTDAPDLDTWEPNRAADWNWTTLTGETLYERVKNSVIPVSITGVPVPPHGNSASSGAIVEFAVGPEDPLVNKFPGDWKPRALNTIESPPNDPLGVARHEIDFTPYNETDTPWYAGSRFDPDSYWLPRMDCGVSRLNDLPAQTQIPRSARMPNIGYLQYVRTGIIPDDEGAPYAEQEGTPFRLLSYAPSTDNANQSLPGSESYPDWALLDLLYIPSTLTPYGSLYNPSTGIPMSNNASTNLAFFGTYGGATAGRVNPNGAVIYTTNADVPHPTVSRTLPLQAVFRGLTVNNNEPIDEVDLANAIEAYLRANHGALRMPAEICNVPAVDRRPSINRTRNDLVRQIVGALTTQDNVFSVWTIGQTVQKKSGNLGHGDFENGDNILAEVRLRLIVERYLDPGTDGVYGNSSNAGIDNVVGSYDDPSPPNSTEHPFQPRYLYRVLASEEVR